MVEGYTAGRLDLLH